MPAVLPPNLATFAVARSLRLLTGCLEWCFSNLTVFLELKP